MELRGRQSVAGDARAGGSGILARRGAGSCWRLAPLPRGPRRLHARTSKLRHRHQHHQHNVTWRPLWTLGFTTAQEQFMRTMRITAEMG